MSGITTHRFQKVCDRRIHTLRAAGRSGGQIHTRRAAGRRGGRAQADLCFFGRRQCCCRRGRCRCLLRFLCCICQFLGSIRYCIRQFLGSIRCCLLHPLTLEHLHQLSLLHPSLLVAWHARCTTSPYVRCLRLDKKKIITGQTSPNRPPRLVVSRSTCPPHYPPPPTRTAL
jgi:hypothetical protein